MLTSSRIAQSARAATAATNSHSGISSAAKPTYDDTFSIAIFTSSSFASGRALRISACERLYASSYDIDALTTAGTSSTAVAPTRFASRSAVCSPSNPLARTAASGDDSGCDQ